MRGGVILLSGAIVFNIATMAYGQDEAPQAALNEHIRRVVAEYQLYAAEERLSLHKEPLLNWTNPAAGIVHGSVFIWTAKGRPEAIVSIHKWFSKPQRPEEHEFHSLSLRSLRAERNGTEMWHPEGAGITLQTLADAPRPADTARARLSQMKELADAFRIVYIEKKDRTELRLLQRPLYRYESTDPGVLDGALFAYVRGTDPDALVLIEARKTNEGVRWQYGIARQNAMALEFSYRGKVVVSLRNCWDRVRNHPEDPYLAIKFVEPMQAKK